LVKRVLLTLLQFLIFCGLLMLGGYWDIIHLILRLKAPALAFIPLWKIDHFTATHDLILNGLIFAAVLWLLILLFELLRKALRPWAMLTTLAFVLAVVLCFAAKLGLPPVA
jgi:hypothetical protein